MVRKFEYIYLRDYAEFVKALNSLISFCFSRLSFIQTYEIVPILTDISTGPHLIKKHTAKETHDKIYRISNNLFTHQTTVYSKSYHKMVAIHTQL